MGKYKPVAMSGRVDLNHRPRRPERRALTGLRYAPNYVEITGDKFTLIMIISYKI